MADEVLTRQVRNTPPLRALWRELISYNEARPNLPDQVAWMHRSGYYGGIHVCVGMRPGCVGMRSGCVGLQPQGAAQPP